MPTALPCRRSPRLPILASLLVLGAAPSLAAAVVTDLVAKAPEAKWYRSLSPAGELPWNGADSDSRGFARHLANAVLENGRSFALVLETHPEWKSGGAIYGVFANIQVPAAARFSALVGFLKGAAATDGATFQVHVFDQATGAQTLLASKAAKADGVLDELSADLGPFAGKTVTFRLQVGAGPTATQDWAVWASAAITQDAPAVLQKAPVGVKTIGAVRLPAEQPGLTGVQKFQPAVIKRIPLTPVGTLPPKHKIEDVGPLPVEGLRTVHDHIYKDNLKANTYYFRPREINLVRDESTGDYRISAVWTQDQKIRTTLTLRVNVDPVEVMLLREALQAAKGSAASLMMIPYDEANIIDMKGWEDWQIEDIRIPTFGSLETDLPITIAMTPETLAQLKPLLEKEGLTAGMRIKTGDIEGEIPIRVGLKYFTGRWYSRFEDVGYSYDERSSLVTLHNVQNLTDFPLKVTRLDLRFRFPNRVETYNGLPCRPEVVIPPGEFRDVQAALVLKDQLLAEYRRAFPTPPPPPKKKNPLLEKALGTLKEEVEKRLDKDKGPEAAKPAEKSVPPDPQMDDFFKSHVAIFSLDIVPDFDCQDCLDRTWGRIEVVSYIERMRKLNVEALANVFDPAAYGTPLEVEKLHLEIRSPYLSAQAKEGLLAAVDLTKDKLKDAVTVYLPLNNQETLSFEYKIKAVLKTGESAESADWEKAVDSLDLTLGTFHVAKIFQK